MSIWFAMLAVLVAAEPGLPVAGKPDLPVAAELGLPVAAEAGPTVDFDTQVIPVLTKAGCNTGACHGAAAGRGGLRLSLYGSDPAFDYVSLALERKGRRVDLAEPARSLLLRKPTGWIDHGGGVRLADDGPGAELLRQWVAQGANRDPRRVLTDYQVTPRAHVLARAGDSAQLAANARFAGARFAEDRFAEDRGKLPVVEDVTGWTVFTAEDPGSVRVDARTGRATVLRRGRHVVIARYLDRVVPIELIVPLGDEPVDFSGQPRQNFIDEEVYERLATLRLPASPPASDGELLRRLTLDLTGRLPTPAETRRYLEDPHAEKRERLVDRLLASEAFNDYWALRLARWLRIRSQPGDSQAAAVYHGWLKRQIAADVGYDRLVRSLLLSSGDTHQVGPANFYRTVAGPREQAEFVSELLLGSRLRCANCHDHPLDRWTQDDYHGLAAIFARVRSGRVVQLTDSGEVTHPRTGDAALPRIPGQGFLDQVADGRGEFTAWLLNPDNPFFARAVVNRLWQSLLGRGLVEPTDDLRVTNPATHPALLDQLAADFARHGYSLRHTLRRIALSSTYGRSGQSNALNEADDRFYSHAIGRPLPAEVLADAISDVTGVAEHFADHPAGTRAVAVFDPRLPSETLDVLGRCPGGEACESSGGATGGLSRMLHLLNGSLLNQRIANPQGRLAKWIEARTPSRQIIDQLYLMALARTPGDRERTYWDDQLAKANDPSERRQVLEDILWSLLTCQEFVTNH